MGAKTRWEIYEKSVKKSMREPYIVENTKNAPEARFTRVL